MTIPITPGPFSFLAEFGRAGGAAFQQHEEDRQQKLKEAQDRARNYIALRMAGLMKPADFEKPEVQAVFHMAGYGPVSPDPTPDEAIRAMKGDYLQSLVAPDTQINVPLGRMGIGVDQTVGVPATAKYSDEFRSLVGAPERGLREQIDARIAQSRAAVPQANLQGATAEAALPEAGLTTRAGQLTTQDQAFNSIADRYIEGLYAVTKKLPASGADAFAAAQADPKIGPVAQKIGQSYFDQAIERLRAKLADEATKRAAAQARLAGASGTGVDDLAKIVQAQQTRITAELNALKEPPSTDRYMAAIAQQQRAAGKKVAPIMEQAEARVSAYDNRVNELQQQMQQSRDMLDNLMHGLLPMTSQAPPGQSGSPQKRAAAMEYERRVQGVTDAAKRKAIAAEIARKYNIDQGGAK